MNPTQNDPDKIPNITPVAQPQPSVDAATYVPRDSTPESDMAAMHAIETIEAEQSTVTPVVKVETLAQFYTQAPQAPQTPPAYTPPLPVFDQPVQPNPFGAHNDPTPLTTLHPETSAHSVQPAQLTVKPLKKKFKISRKQLLLIAGVVVLVAAVVVYFYLQSRNANIVDDSQQTTGNQPGGTFIESPFESSTN